MNVMHTLDPSSVTPQSKPETVVTSLQGRNLSPAEERAQQAEQRTALRQARSVHQLYISLPPNMPIVFYP